MACCIADPGSVAVAFTLTTLQPSAPVASLTYVASFAQAGSAHWTKPTFFLGGTLVRVVDCTTLVGTVKYLSRLACALASEVGSTDVAPDAGAEPAAPPHAVRASVTSPAAAATASRRDRVCM